MLNTDITDIVSGAANYNHNHENLKYPILPFSKTNDISSKNCITPKLVEQTALEKKIIPERYIRNLNTITIEQQLKLLRSKVFIIGVGGLGGSVLENLSRIGVGIIIIVDGDQFSPGNLNRQKFCFENNIGKKKVKEAITQAQNINSAIELYGVDTFITRDNIGDIIKSPDMIIDCLDNISTRFILSEYASTNHVPVISAAISGNTGHLMVIDPSDRTLHAIYGNPEEVHSTGNETTLGCLAHTVNLMAALQSSEAVKVLLNTGNIMKKKLLVIDLLENSFETLFLS